ncbi:2-trimethylaminoethylphosphonate dioxygenase [Amycolatopsis saalfeldensis]|uniref:Gamma-butyrobetaine dioxygenase n=1 Tax=Amycolatopsis saalfeldensis TaxID=394193 RepID=A0A1H8Y9T5_9PSEU|nr:TauD/TfdA family dioxygenase [Amycolatopsis saalfeldensis]SEP48857.1 gamma-butyrobetaine dioxygenase [Amycolatopsis saalfeldensis]
MTTTATRAGGATPAFPPIWLRDNCPCERCRDPRNGQKLFGITDLPADLTVRDTEATADTITVTFGPDGHRGVFSRAWLEAHLSTSDGDGRTEAAKQLWQARDLEGRLPAADWAAYRDDPAERARVLRAVRDLGFAVLHGTPTEEETVLAIARTFGYPRETNYGTLFDVRVEANPGNLAFTGMRIAPHTDNPYRDPVPTLQLLHCLANAAEGGDSGLVDGFTAASLLRADDEAAFRILTTTLVPFAWSDASTSLRADRPLIDVDPAGHLREVRFNNRSMQALRLDPAATTAFYAAYRRFAEIIARPELLLTFRLEPGDCLVFDNTRLLHARTAFAESGARHLQGCYADLDALASALRTLEETA